MCNTKNSLLLHFLTLATLRDWRQVSRGSILDRGRDFLVHRKVHTGSGAYPSILFRMYKECIDRPVVERPRYEDDHCPVANAEVRNAWNYTSIPVAYRKRRVWGVQTPTSPKFRRPSKIVPNSTRLWKLLKIYEFRTPTPQDIREKKGSKILKLPPVRNCFTLAMANKLVVIIHILKVPKIKKMLLYEMTFLVPNYSCVQNPWLGGYRP